MKYCLFILTIFLVSNLELSAQEVFKYRRILNTETQVGKNQEGRIVASSSKIVIDTEEYTIVSRSETPKSVDYVCVNKNNTRFRIGLVQKAIDQFYWYCFDLTNKKNNHLYILKL